MILPLVTAFTDLAALQTPTQPYVFDDHSSKETEEMAKDIIAAMYHYGGVGISANQVGLPWSVFAMRGADADLICFNPVIAMPGEETIRLEEGCLSFPGLKFRLNRWRHLRVRFSDHHGATDSFTYTGMTARVFQHELEHLNGELFFEGVNRLHMDKALRQAKNKGFDYYSLGFMKHVRK